MRLNIVGDLVINQFYPVLNIDTEVIKFFQDSDLNVVNIEAPITTSVSKIVKTGPHLKSHKESVHQVLNVLNIDVATLANNHILDYGEQGLVETISFCEKNNIQTVGAGSNLEEASKTLYISSVEGEIGIINIAENEWTSATKDTAGANPMDIIENVRQIKALKKKVDFIILIVHGGNEYNHYPSPRMVKQYRFYAESGADVVIGHHTHCIGGYEVYKDVPIFYSLGNFLFTTNKKKLNSWYEGLVVQLIIKKGKKVAFEVIPVSQSKENHTLTLMQGEDKDEVLNKIKKINKVFSNALLLKEEWGAFIKKVQPGYIKSISPFAGIRNRYVKAVFYRLKIHNLFLHQNYIKEHLNRIRCEAHLDVSKEVLSNYLRDNNKVES